LFIVVRLGYTKDRILVWLMGGLALFVAAIGLSTFLLGQILLIAGGALVAGVVAWKLIARRGAPKQMAAGESVAADNRDEAPRPK
jgi:hypothetical protein